MWGYKKNLYKYMTVHSSFPLKTIFKDIAFGIGIAFKKISKLT